MNKVAIYIRVSTTHQIDKDSLPMQRKDLIAYAELILGIPDYVIFEDAGYSGKNTDRPGFQDMINRIRAGEFSHLLVWKIDRISRNLLDFAEMYSELKRLRVTFVSKNEQFDTSTAMGEAMLKIILVFAELERNMTAERVRATMISKASAGEWNGGRVPFGYSYNDGVFSICEPEAAVCRLIRDDYLEHKSLLHTARMLNDKGYHARSGAEWSPVTVHKIVSSPFYAGIYRYNRYKGAEHRTVNPQGEWIMIQNHHAAIFSIEDYEKMSAIRKRNVNRDHTKYTERVHVFQGLMFCGSCGARMVSAPGRHRRDGFINSLYYCPTARRSNACKNQTVSESVIGDFIINYILNMLNAKKHFGEIATPADLERHLLRGLNFDAIDHIGADGLQDFFTLLSRYRSADSFRLSAARKCPEESSVVTSLRKEKEKQERALKRLQSLYLYSEDTISEKDFIVRKKEITDSIEDINHRLGMETTNVENGLTDEEFMRKASHLLISTYLKERDYIYYPALAVEVSPEVLRTYMATILDSVFVTDGKITRITFANGLTHIFVYK